MSRHAFWRGVRRTFGVKPRGETWPEMRERLLRDPETRAAFEALQDEHRAAMEALERMIEDSKRDEE